MLISRASSQVERGGLYWRGIIGIKQRIMHTHEFSTGHAAERASQASDRWRELPLLSPEELDERLLEADNLLQLFAAKKECREGAQEEEVVGKIMEIRASFREWFDSTAGQGVMREYAQEHTRQEIEDLVGFDELLAAYQSFLRSRPLH